MTMNRLKSDDGFTLMEAVMSLMVVSLSLAALLAVGNLCAKAQKAVAAEKTASRALADERMRLTTALAAVEPVTETGFVGGDHALAQLHDKAMTVIYTAGPGFHMRYVSASGVDDHWPGNATGAVQRNAVQRRLRAVILSDSHGAPVIVVRLRADQSQACRFDPVSQTCREGGA